MSEEKQIEKTEENLEKEYVPFHLHSFAELDEYRRAEKVVHSIASLYYDYKSLMINILNSDEIPEPFVISQIYSLTTEFLTRLSAIRRQRNEDTFLTSQQYSFGNVAIFKDADGNTWWFGVPTNKFIDRGKDILAESSHIDFVRALDEGEFPYPDLYIWHIPVVVGDTRMVDYDARGFLVASGLIFPEYESLVYNILKNSDEPIGMSHAVKRVNVVRDESDERIIRRYRSYEFSLLPLSKAANLYTAFNANN